MWKHWNCKNLEIQQASLNIFKKNYGNIPFANTKEGMITSYRDIHDTYIFNKWNPCVSMYFHFRFKSLFIIYFSVNNINNNNNNESLILGI